MITSIHTLIYSDEAQTTRAFLRDVLQWPSVQDSDSEPDWPIFCSGPSEVGVHPTSSTWQGELYSQPRHHELSLMCDDIGATVEELRSRGAEFNGEVEDMGFGLGIQVRVPGADDILLYQPNHPTGYGL